MDKGDTILISTGSDFPNKNWLDLLRKGTKVIIPELKEVIIKMATNTIEKMISQLIAKGIIEVEWYKSKNKREAISKYIEYLNDATIPDETKLRYIHACLFSILRGEDKEDLTDLVYLDVLINKLEGVEIVLLFEIYKYCKKRPEDYFVGIDELKSKLCQYSSHFQFPESISIWLINLQEIGLVPANLAGIKCRDILTNFGRGLCEFVSNDWLKSKLK